MTTLPNPAPAGDAGELARLRAELAAQFAAAGPRAYRPVPWPAFREELLALYRPPLRAKATHGRMRHVLDLVGALVGPEGTAADAFNPGLVARFITSRPATEAAETTKSLLAAFRTAANYAAAQGYVFVSPFAVRRSWVRARAPKREKHHHSAAAIARVLELGRQTAFAKRPGSVVAFKAWRTYALASTVAYTGVRKMEALRLHVEDVDIPHRVIRIVERDGNVFKTPGSAVPVVMPDVLAGILMEWLAVLEDYLSFRDGIDRRCLFPNQGRTSFWNSGGPGMKPLDRLVALGKRAGVEGFTFLSLRHSWATMAEAWGLSETMIARQLRHTTTRTQKTYRHADLANMRDAIRGVGFGDQTAAAAPPPAVEPAIAAAPPRPPGVYHPPVLTPEAVAEARELRSKGYSYAVLCERFGCSKSTLHSALHGKTHRDCLGPLAEDL